MNRSAFVILITIVAALCLLPVISDNDSDADVGSAVIGSTEYSSVAEALSKSVSGDVVYVVPETVTVDGKNVEQASITSDVTVKKGVTLVLPYSEKKNPSGTEDGGENAYAKLTFADSQIDKYLYLTLLVGEGVTVTVYGDLIVGGILSKEFTFDYQGHTSGAFSCLDLDGQVNVMNGGRLYCYGLITGSGTVNLKDGAESYEPMVVTDYVGGDLVVVSYQNGQSFFNRYAFPNIQSKFSMTSGATAYGLVNLYANKTFNKTVEPIISDTEGFIILADGATLTTSYNKAVTLTAYTSSNMTKAEKDAAWSSNIYPDIGRKLVKISGGASFGYIEPEVQGRQANSADTVFSVPYNIWITLENGNYQIDNDIRFLPGSRLAVAADATLDVTGMLLMYNGLLDKEFRDKFYPTTDILDYRSKYFSNIAVLIVNGELNVKGTFTGLLQCNLAGGTVNIDSGATVSLTAQKYGAKGSFQGSSVDNLSTMDLYAFAMDAYGNEFSLVPGKSYTSSNKAEHTLASYSCYDPETGNLVTIALDQTVTGSWYAGTYAVKYSLNGGTGTVPTDLNRYESGDTASVLGQNGISKEGYRFSGWATNAKGTGTIYSPGQTIKVTSNITLYAVWTGSVPVTGVSLNKTSATLDVGGTVTLKATVTPSDASNKTVSWSSSSSKIATVSNGKVTAVAAGTATITATTADGSYKATCKVTVNGSVAVTGISLDKTTATVGVGETITLKATVKPSDATDSSVIWSTSSSKVATVSGGTVKGAAAGKATITATTTDGGYTATCEVTVTAEEVSVTGVTLSATEISLKEGTSKTVSAIVAPTNATDKSVKWSTADKSIATVSKGKITGVSVGTTTITVTTVDGSYKATCEVTVTSDVVSVTGIDINSSSEVMGFGKTLILTYSIKPSDATNTDVTWASSNESVATVKDGVVTAVAEGLTTITVTTADGGYTDKCTVIVENTVVEVTGIVISKTTLEINQGSAGKLSATVFPNNATSKTVIWYSMDTAVATVQDGVVTGVAPGTTIIKVATADGRFVDSCQVTVKKNYIPVYAITLDPVATVEVGKTKDLGLVITPADATIGYTKWTTSDASVATVDNGQVTGVSPGKAVIKVDVDGLVGECALTVTEEDIPVIAVSLDTTEKTLDVGGTVTLNATVAPSNATDKSVSWTTTDSKIATVSDGTVTAISEGTATISVITTDGGLKASCIIHVINTAIDVTGVTLDKTSATFAIGDALQLTATVLPSDATDKTVFWTTSDSNIALVQDGTVTGVSTGTATITVTTVDGNYSAQCTVNVLPAVIHVTSVTLDKSSISIKIGDTSNLKAIVLPSDASDRSVTWSTSNKTVAEVSNGVVKGITAGTATITATTVDGAYAATCEVTVEPLPSGDDSALIYAVIGIVAIMGVLAAALLFRKKTV